MLRHKRYNRPPLRLAVTLLAAIAAGAVSLATGRPVLADAPVENGTIAYMRFAGDESHVMLVEPDGSDTREIPLPRPGFLPAWSSDGSRLMLTTFVDETLRPMIVSPDGGGATILHVPEAPQDLALQCRTWSPNDDLLLCTGDSFSAEHPESSGIYSIRSSDGSDLTRLTTGAFPPVFTDLGSCGGGDMPGGFSPDGSQFVFTRARCGSGPVPDRNQKAALFVADADGGNLRQLTAYGLPWSHEQGLARWSPDGSRILFGGAHGNLFTIDPDGGHMKQIAIDVSGSRSFAIGPDWSPDGTRIAFSLFADEASGLYSADLNGGDLVLLAAQGADFVDEPDWGAAP